MDANSVLVCEELVKAHCAKWQVLNRSQWKYKFRGKALVRYIDATRMREEEVKLLLEYLCDPECIKTLSLYDQSVSADWSPVRAWLEVSNKGVGNVGGVRLYHALQTDPAESADGPYLVENGCAYKVYIEYHWSEDSAPVAPKSESGIARKISNLQRDPESGKYSYAIETHERVQQDILEYLTSTTVFNDTYVEQHIGVKESKVESAGKKASVGGGRLVSRQVSKNADCTKDVANRTVVEKRVAGASESVHVGLTGTTSTTVNRNMPSKASSSGLGIGESVENSKTDGGLWNQTIRRVVRSAITRIAQSCRKTVFAENDSQRVVQGTDPGFTHVKDASGGVVSEKTVSRTADGSYEVSTHTVSEKKVEGASESVHVGLTGTVKTTHNRNMPSKASSSGLKVGESVENSETEGGLWNQTIRSVVRESLTWLGRSCRKTIFGETHTEHQVVGTDPGFQHASEAGGGVIEEKRVSVTSGGAYDVTSHKTVEKPVKGASESVSVTLSGATSVTHNRNMSSPASTAGLDVGESVENSKTEGGLWNQTIRKRVKSALIRISESCRMTVMSHVHSSTRIQGSYPGFSHASSARGGVVSQKTVSRTSDGNYSVDERSETELPVRKSSVRIHKGLHGTQTTTSNLNQRNAPNGPRNVGESVEYSVTPGGLYNTSETKHDGASGGVLGREKSESRFSISESKTENKKGDTADDPNVSFKQGVIVRKSVTRNGDGTHDEREAKTTAKDWIHEYDWVNDNVRIYVVKYGNQKNKFAGKTIPDKASRIQKSDSINEFGLHDGSLTWVIDSTTTISGNKFAKRVYRSPQIDSYAVQRNERTGRLYHFKVTAQMIHTINGDYEDFLSERNEADPKRDTKGVVAVRLVRGPYLDTQGNGKAEWMSVKCNGVNSNGWVACTNECLGDRSHKGVHGKHQQFLDYVWDDVVNKLFGKSDHSGTSDANSPEAKIAGALENLPNALSVIMLGQTYADRAKLLEVDDNSQNAENNGSDDGKKKGGKK